LKGLKKGGRGFNKLFRSRPYRVLSVAQSQWERQDPEFKILREFRFMRISSVLVDLDTPTAFVKYQLNRFFRFRTVSSRKRQVRVRGVDYLRLEDCHKNLKLKSALTQSGVIVLSRLGWAFFQRC
jgi:hypothetical protein